MSEKAMAPHSSTLAWKIPWMEKSGGLQSMGLLRVGHDWVTSLSHFTFMHWRRKWQPTPVFLPGESQGQQNLVGWRLWGRTESDTTEAIYQQWACRRKHYEEWIQKRTWWWTSQNILSVVFPLECCLKDNRNWFTWFTDWYHLTSLIIIFEILLLVFLSSLWLAW